MSAPKEILDLVERFQRNKDAYRSPQYNETQLRREFLDPFFKALGWDIDNEQGYAEAYKDVIHEDAIKVGEATKAPDYCFRIGGARKFFLEAKKPAVDIKHDVSPVPSAKSRVMTKSLILWSKRWSCTSGYPPSKRHRRKLRSSARSPPLTRKLTASFMISTA